MAKPVVDGLERKMGDRLSVAHVDVNSDSGEALAEKYGIRGVPAFILLDTRGAVVYKQLGGRPDVGLIERRVAER